MTDSRLVVVREQVRREHRLRQVVVLAQESRDFFARAHGVAADYVDLGTVTRRQHDRLGGGRPQRERLDGCAQIATREVESLSQLDRGRLVAYAEKDDLHFQL